MKVKTVDVSDADKLSARLFFDQLFGYYDLEKARVLDAFARNGQLTVSSYDWRLADAMQLECWELGQEHDQALREHTPHVRIGCSYGALAQAIELKQKYDLLVIDTPQGLHKSADGQTKVEHFDFLRQAFSVLEDQAVVVLYVNKSPYDNRVIGSHGYDEYAEYDFDTWMHRRVQFYGTATPGEEQAMLAYRFMAAAQGFDLKSCVITPCYSDVPGMPPYAFRLGLEFVRNTGGA